MKILITGPNINEQGNFGGIISVIRTIISIIPVEYIYFYRSPQIKKKNKLFNIFWVKNIFKYTNLIKNENFDLIHIHTSFTVNAVIRDFILILIGGILSQKTILHIHGGKFLFSKPSSLIVRIMIFLSFKMASSIIVLSTKEKKSVFQLYSEKISIYVLENAINLDELPIGIKKRFKKPFNIVFIGRICESKGIYDIKESLEYLNNFSNEFYFNLYGDGDLVQLITNELKELLDDRFSYHGIVYGNRRWQAVSDSDIFLLPSRYGEGLPMAMLEAMAIGTIVVVTDDASMGIVVQNEVNGFIVKKYDPENLFEVLKKIMLADYKKLLEISENAKLTIKNGYSSEMYIKRLLNIYKEVSLI